MAVLCSAMLCLALRHRASSSGVMCLLGKAPSLQVANYIWKGCNCGLRLERNPLFLEKKSMNSHGAMPFFFLDRRFFDKHFGCNRFFAFGQCFFSKKTSLQSFFSFGQ